MKKTMLYLALMLAMLAAPLAAADHRPGVPARGLVEAVAWMFALISPARHGAEIISGSGAVEGVGPGARGEHGSHIVVDGSAAPGDDDPPIDDPSTRHGSHIVVDG